MNPCNLEVVPEYGREEFCVDLMKPVESNSLDLDLVDRQREDINHVFLMEMENRGM